MTGQMCWLAVIDGAEKRLYLRTADSQPWRPYTAFPQYAVADYTIPRGSKGWATYQKLRQCGWVLVPTEEGERVAKELTEVRG